MTLEEAVSILDAAVPDPSSGLPDAVFEYVSRTTPLVNVDLLIKDEHGRTLLAWRDDPYAGTGWHVPGGIVRFKEAREARVLKVAETEIGAAIRFGSEPIAVNELIHRERGIRGHFISFLYRCFLSREFDPSVRGISPGKAGYLDWHGRCPEDLIRVHEIYRKYIDGSHQR